MKASHVTPWAAAKTTRSLRHGTTPSAVNSSARETDFIKSACHRSSSPARGLWGRPDMRIRFALGTRTRAWARAVGAGAKIVVCDHGAEPGVHFRDRVRSVRRGDHVERAAEDAPEAAKDERVVVDEQDTLARRARAARRGWDHPGGYAGG